jgi:hypothetical protein
MAKKIRIPKPLPPRIRYGFLAQARDRCIFLKGVASEYKREGIEDTSIGQQSDDHRVS